MDLVFLYGPPAVGKLTVASKIVALTGYRLFHNHLTLDPVLALFDFGTEPLGRLVTRLRLDLLSEAARADLPGVVFTFVYARGKDDKFIERVIEAVEPAGGRVCFALLTCREEELLGRVGMASRARFGKLRDVRRVRELMAHDELMAPIPQRESLILDVTTLPAREAARRVIAHFGLPRRDSIDA